MPVGETTVLTCHHDTPGNLTFKWLKDGQEIHESGSNLTLYDFAQPNAGNYTCSVIKQSQESPESEPVMVYLAGELIVSYICHYNL